MQQSDPTSASTSSKQEREPKRVVFRELPPEDDEPKSQPDDLDDKELKRRERNYWQLIRIGVFTLLAILGGVVVVAYTCNLIFPASWRWLSASDMAAIKDLVTSIIAGLLMSISIKFFTKKRR